MKIFTSFEFEFYLFFSVKNYQLIKCFINIYHTESFLFNIKESPSFEDIIIQKTHSTSLDHTVENASCFVQSLSNYNSLKNHALSLYVDVHSDQLSNSTMNIEPMAQTQFKQIDQNAQYNKQIDEKSSSKENTTNGYYNSNKVIETKEICSNQSAIEIVQLKHVQTNEQQNGETRATSRNQTIEDLSNKENEENYENDEYTKIPVKDLISTFEKQTRPVIRYKLREDKLPEPLKMSIGFNAEADDNKQTLYEENTMMTTTNQNEQLEQTNCLAYSQNGSELHEEFESTTNHMNGNFENENVDTNTQQGKRFSVFFFFFFFCKILFRFFPTPPNFLFFTRRR